MVSKLPDNFKDFWDCIPSLEDDIWEYIKPASGEYSRRRQALELLCGALWHLELTKALGELPTEGMIDYREKVKQLTGRIPWQIWLEQQRGITTKFRDAQLSINFSFGNTSDDFLRVLIQSMLIANVSIRLDATRDILRGITNLHQKKLAVLANRLQMTCWLNENQNKFLDTTTNLQKSVVMVTAFRDWYMHGEISSGKDKPLKLFREKTIGSYSLWEIANACIEVWNTLINLVRTDAK